MHTFWRRQPSTCCHILKRMYGPKPHHENVKGNENKSLKHGPTTLTNLIIFIFCFSLSLVHIPTRFLLTCHPSFYKHYFVMEISLWDSYVPLLKIQNIINFLQALLCLSSIIVSATLITSLVASGLLLNYPLLIEIGPRWPFSAPTKAEQFRSFSSLEMGSVF